MSDKGSDLIPVKVDQLVLSNLGFVVLLKGAEDRRSLPIFIGGAEAQAIAIRLNNVEVPRPLTHDLLKNVLDFLECRLMRVVVCDLREGTFYAQLVLDRDGEQMSLDARPSDAIALALRCGASIFVARSVMDEAGKVFETPKAAQSETPPREPEDPVEALREQLERAVQEERYEEAARLRDEINRLKRAHSDN